MSNENYEINSEAGEEIITADTAEADSADAAEIVTDDMPEDSDVDESDDEIEVEMTDEEFKKLIKKVKRWTSFKASAMTLLVIILLIAGLVVFKYLRSGIPVSKLSVFSSGIIDKSVFNKAEGIYATIENTYINEFDKQAVRDGLYKGMVDALEDPYSVYYTKEEFEKMMESSNGSFEGIGAYLQQDPDTLELTVSRPMKDSPAEKAGLMAGDLIVSVDGEDITQQDINVIVSKIRGTAGTIVELEIVRKDEHMTVSIERGVVYEASVASSMIEGEDGIGYIYITSFEEDTANQFKEELLSLKEQSATSLIIDLRDNGGGYVDVCGKIADMILPEGNIVTIKDKHGIEDKIDSSDDEYIQMPIVILANENTASASEILIGALKDYDYATVVGTNTFGKGIVQNIIPLDDGSGLKVTIGKYYTPNGTCIHEIGIKPDIEIELDYDRMINGDGDNQLDKAIETIKKMKNS